jgi:hypothetical protein
MGGQSSRGSAMTEICWWLVDKLLRVLESAERDAVRGDLAESNETGAQALRDVLGLVVRRQLALWQHWRPWLVLAGLVVPLGLLVSLVSSRVVGSAAIYPWMYFSNLDWAIVNYRAFWIILVQVISLVFPEMLALVCLSWTIGFALGPLARRSILVNGVLFCMVLWFGQFVAVPWYTQLQLRVISQPPFERGYAEPGFSLVLYRAMFPLLAQIVLVLLPSMWGMYKGLGLFAFPRLLRAILWIPAIATVAALASGPAIFWTAVATHDLTLPQRSWHLPLFPFAIAGPVMYFVATATRSRLRRAA